MMVADDYKTRSHSTEVRLPDRYLGWCGVKPKAEIPVKVNVEAVCDKNL
jgi:hypothetical protein